MSGQCHCAFNHRRAKTSRRYQNSQWRGQWLFDATVNPYIQSKPISGTVVFQDIDLAVFKPFFPSFERLTGNGLVAGKISGSLMQPKFVGDIELSRCRS